MLNFLWAAVLSTLEWVSRPLRMALVWAFFFVILAASYVAEAKK